MFDVNLNDIERIALCNLLCTVDFDIPETYERVYSFVDGLLEIRFNMGKRQGDAIVRDNIINAIVAELQHN